MHHLRRTFYFAESFFDKPGGEGVLKCVLHFSISFRLYISLNFVCKFLIHWHTVYTSLPLFIFFLHGNFLQCLFFIHDCFCPTVKDGRFVLLSGHMYHTSCHSFILHTNMIYIFFSFRWMVVMTSIYCPTRDHKFHLHMSCNGQTIRHANPALLSAPYYSGTSPQHSLSLINTSVTTWYIMQWQNCRTQRWDISGQHCLWLRLAGGLQLPCL